MNLRYLTKMKMSSVLKKPLQMPLLRLKRKNMNRSWLQMAFLPENIRKYGFAIEGKKCLISLILLLHSPSGLSFSGSGFPSPAKGLRWMDFRRLFIFSGSFYPATASKGIRPRQM